MRAAFGFVVFRHFGGAESCVVVAAEYARLESAVLEERYYLVEVVQECVLVARAS